MHPTRIALLLVVQLASCKGKTPHKNGSAEATPVATRAATDDADAAYVAPSNDAAPAATPGATADTEEALPLGGLREVIKGPAKSLLPNLVAQDFAPAYDPKEPPSAAISEAGALHKQAYALHKAGKLAEAKGIYLQTLRKNPSHIRARYNLATTLVGLGENDKALALLAELQRAPKCSDCWLGDLATTDSKWAPLWGSRLFHAVVYEIEHDIDAAAKEVPKNEDLDLIATLCRPDETPDGELDDNDEGTVHCMKGGKRNGAYYNYETGYDMSEGATNTRGFYKNDREDGTWSHWETFGDSYDGDFRNGKKHGIWKIESRSDITYEVNVDGRFEGTHWTISSDMEAPDGYPTKRIDYKAGKRNGLYRRWSLDEKLRVLTEAGSYRDDKKSGAWINYDDETGLPIRLVTFVDGHREGPYAYWSSTKVLAKGSITNGSGAWVEYSGDTLVASGLYKDHKKEGPWIDPVGKGAYASGVRVGPWRVGNSDTYSEGRFKNGRRVGLWTYYSEGDSIMAKGMFVNDRPDGKWMAQVDGGESELVFKKGRLLRIDDEPFAADEYDYSLKAFSSSGEIYSANDDDDDEYPY